MINFSLTNVIRSIGLIGIVYALSHSPVLAAERLLYDPASLQESLAQPNPPIVLDVRNQDAYTAGHIPGARWIDTNLWRDTTLTETGLTNREFWREQLGAAGLTQKSSVVVVGDSLPEAARVWWLLGYLGLPQVALLDGGLTAWTAADYELATDIPDVRTTQPEINFQSARLAAIEAVDPSGDTEQNCTILDNRSQAEFSGARGVGTRTGHIPGATHLEWNRFTDKSGKLLSAKEIKALLESEGIDTTQPIVNHCQTGGRSSVAVLALEIAGVKQVKNYYRGWSEYSGVLTAPVEK